MTPEHDGQRVAAAGFLEQHRCFAEIVARIVRRRVDRVLVHLGEHFRRHLVLHLVQDRELRAFRQRRRRGKLAVLEVAADPLILAVEQVLVRPLEIKGEVEGPGTAGA